MEDLVTLDEAARRLGVIRRRAQAMVTAGQLPAEKVGMQWVVPAAGLRLYEHTSVRQPGRPLTQRGAWSEIAQLPHTRPASTGELDERRRRVRSRARHRDFYVHPGVLDRLRADQRVVLSGRDAAAEAGAPVDASDVDAYIREADVDQLIRRVRGRETFADANVHLHVVDDDVWPFQPGVRMVPSWVAWLDLEDREDRAAVTLLDRLLGGRLRA